MSVREWKFRAPELETELHAVSVTCEAPRAILVVNHGINEHVGRYDEFFKAMCEKGIDCHSFDMRTFGKSQPDRRHMAKIDRFTDLVDDLLAFCSTVKEQYKEKALPLFVSGQSLGGLIAASAVRKDPARFAGLVLFSPAIDVDMTLNMRIQSLFGLPLAALLPWVRSVPAVNIEDLSDDPEVGVKYLKDPHTFPGNVRIRTAYQAQQGMRALQRSYHEISVPVFGLHGDCDRVTSMPAHQRFMDKISSADKTLRVVPGGYHELLLGTQKRECADCIAQWVLDHASGGQAKSAL